MTKLPIFKVTVLTLVSILLNGSWFKTAFQIEDPDPYPQRNGGQIRHARGPVHPQIHYIDRVSKKIVFHSFPTHFISR